MTCPECCTTPMLKPRPRGPQVPRGLNPFAMPPPAVGNQKIPEGRSSLKLGTRYPSSEFPPSPSLVRRPCLRRPIGQRRQADHLVPAVHDLLTLAENHLQRVIVGHDRSVRLGERPPNGLGRRSFGSPGGQQMYRRTAAVNILRLPGAADVANDDFTDVAAEHLAEHPEIILFVLRQCARHDESGLCVLRQDAIDLDK